MYTQSALNKFDNVTITTPMNVLDGAAETSVNTLL
jgi:hypothetical protein